MSNLVIRKLQDLQKSQGEELKEALTLTSSLLTERDTFREEASLLAKQNKEMETQKLINVTAAREKINKLEHKIKMLYEAA